jgi:formate hydrogenlyase subunit 5
MQTAHDINVLFDQSDAGHWDRCELAVSATDHEFTATLAEMSGKDVVLIGLFCVQGFEGHPGFTLLYVFEKRDRRNIAVLKRQLRASSAGSVATLFPSACWFEREIRDGFGIEFHDAFDKRRLFLHESYPADFHPLLKEFANGPIDTVKTIDPGSEYPFKEMIGEGVYQIPVGPVHAGIIEPGHFRFSVIGETVFNLELRMFYKHRGIEKLAEGTTPERCMPIAESISGDESVANAVAFAMAAEKVGETTIPTRAWYLRTIMLELERIYSHLGDMAGMIVDVAFPRGASPFFILREDIFRQNEALTGSRFMKGMVRPGGLTHDIPDDRFAALSRYLEQFEDECKSAADRVRSVSSVVDRLETTGVIKPELANLLNITGPAARASGVGVDTRLDHPYGLYPTLDLKKRTSGNGDVLARFNVKSEEILDSVSIVRGLAARIPEGGVYRPVEARDGHSLSLVESARGQSLHWVNIRNGQVDRYKVRTASFCNWQAIEHAILGNIVPDFPLINKSLNLSYAGTDL